MIKAYNLNTILAEKIESILVRNVSNTRGRDFYDICILAMLNKVNLDRLELKKAIWKKAEEVKSTIYHEKQGGRLVELRAFRWINFYRPERKPERIYLIHPMWSIQITRQSKIESYQVDVL